MFGWFKKRETVELNVDDGKGGVQTRTITKGQLKELVDKGALTKLDACVSHYWDPRLSKPTTKNLIIGEDIKRETYENFKDAKGEVHVVGVFKAGELELSYVSKTLWDDMMRAMTNL